MVDDRYQIPFEMATRSFLIFKTGCEWQDRLSLDGIFFSPESIEIISIENGKVLAISGSETFVLLNGYLFVYLCSVWQSRTSQETSKLDITAAY